MRPRVDYLRRQQVIRKKSHFHWLHHKHEILLKRMQNNVKVKRLQGQKIPLEKFTDLEIHDFITSLSLNERRYDDKDVESSDDAASDITFYRKCFNPLHPAPRSYKEKKSYVAYFLSLNYGDKLV